MVHFSLKFYGFSKYHTVGVIRCTYFISMKGTKIKKNVEQADFIRAPLKKPSLAERQYSEPVVTVDHVDGAGFSRSLSTPAETQPGFNPDILPDGICISPQKFAPRLQDTSHSAVRDAEVGSFEITTDADPNYFHKEHCFLTFLL